MPPSAALRRSYLFYLKHVIPHIGRLFLGNPDCYRLLSRYTVAFGNCRRMGAMMQHSGLNVQYRRYFFGCATGLHGWKPA